MKNSVLKTLLVATSLVSVFVGVSCKNDNSTKVDASCTSVKEAIQKLATSKNYTINVSTATGPLEITNRMYYTENAFYDDYLGDEYGYCKVDEGVFYFDRYNRSFTTSTLLKDSSGKKYDSIWDNGFFYGFSSLDLSEFDDATGSEFTSSKKINKLSFMKIFSIDQTQYTSVNGINLSVGDNVNSLTFTISLTSGEEHICTISDYGTTEIEYLQKNLASGKTYYTPDSSMQKIIDLFANYNYTQFIYDTDFDKDNPVGWSKFTETYFISGYTNEYIKYAPSSVLSMSGIVGFNNYVVNDNVTLNGGYYTMLFDDSLSMITSFYYNEDPYVPNVYVYPTYLEALSSTQYFVSAGIDDKYYTSNLSIISDFCTNFQLWDGLSELGVTPTGLYMTYDQSYQGKDTVTFSLEYSYYGYLYTTDFIFSDFNQTKEEALEQENIKKYVNAYYNSSRPTVTCGDTSKTMTISGKTNWILSDDYQASFAYEYFNTNGGEEITFMINGEEISVTPYESVDNNNYEIIDGKIYVKNAGKTYVYIYELADGSYQFCLDNMGA
jgi:hypothetical protein